MGESKPIEPGAVLKDRYRVESALDQGDMGSVWRATDEVLRRPVAIKVPHAQHLSVPGFRDRFEREVKRLVALEHPHIVPIHDAGRVDGVPYAVMAFLTGGSLAQRLETRGTGSPRRLPPGDLRNWLPDVAHALDFIHGQGVIHRDVKPANILFDSAGAAYISDFGLSKALFGEQSLTPSSVIVGSPAYLPPEAMVRESASEEITGRYDQYSLGTVVYELVTGDLPFASGSPALVLLKKSREPAPSLAVLAPEAPPHLVRAVDRSLLIDASRRFARCADFAKAACSPSPSD